MKPLENAAAETTSKPLTEVIELEESSKTTEITNLVTTETAVSAKDIFRFAKWILGVSVTLFAALAIVRMLGLGDKEATKEVWDYTKVAINSIISIVIGFYFGTRKQEKS
jgi:hypothetical protein